MAAKRRKSQKQAAVAVERTLTREQCAEELSINPDTLKRYVREGCPCSKNGKAYLFNASEVAAWMQREGKTGRPGRPVEQSEDLEAVRIRKETAMAVNWEYRNKVLEGELVNREEYRRHWVREWQVVKNKLRGLGAALAPACVGLDAGEIQSVIDERVDQVCRELCEP